MTFDLKAMSRRELEALKAKIDKQLERLKTVDLKKALEAAEAAAKQHGFSLKDLTGAVPAKAAKPAKPAVAKKAKAAKAVSAPRYCNPEDTSITWTGRGRRPEWIKAGLAAGKSLEDFAIK